MIITCCKGLQKGLFTCFLSYKKRQEREVQVTEYLTGDWHGHAP